MGWIIALIVGGIAGWLASKVMNRDASMGIFWNIVVGCVGSLVGNAVAGPLLGISGSVQEFSLTGLIIAFVGAVILLGIVNMAQRKNIR
ncbi:MAG: GlsB/YeaQ/YmgE family stress response membrane protein [Sphingomonadaceae bacterium]